MSRFRKQSFLIWQTLEVSVQLKVRATTATRVWIILMTKTQYLLESALLAVKSGKTLKYIFVHFHKNNMKTKNRDIWSYIERLMLLLSDTVDEIKQEEYNKREQHLPTMISLKCFVISQTHCFLFPLLAFSSVLSFFCT